MTTRKINIEGMSCGHCVHWVMEALKKIDGVKDARVSLEARDALVDLDETMVTDEMMIAAVTQAGYSVKSIS